jgi:hypothetical protein
VLKVQESVNVNGHMLALTAASVLKDMQRILEQEDVSQQANAVIWVALRTAMAMVNVNKVVA